MTSPIAEREDVSVKDVLQGRAHRFRLGADITVENA
jgi:hypothetical protein